MASLVWPSTIPDKPLVDAYNETPPRDVVKSPMDVGPAKMRRRTTSGVRKFSVTMMMTDAEVADLDTFYETTTRNGVLRFDLENPRTGTTVEMRFMEAPKYKLVSEDDYEVSMKLEALP